MINEKSADYLEGYKSAERFHNSPIYGQFDRDTPADHVIKMFKPNVTESMMMVASPLPKDRRDWIEGFNDWKKENLNKDVTGVHPLGCLCDDCLFDKEGKN